MANGGIIGPPNPVTPAVCSPENVVSITASGTYNKTSGAPSTVGLVVVAGGGSGGPEGGGGGGGGFVYIESFPLAADGTPVTIGGGGGPAASDNGDNSVFGDGSNPVTAVGGGGGGGSGAPGPLRNGYPGGSGGGPGWRDTGSGASENPFPGGAGSNPVSPGYSTPRCTTNGTANTGGGGAGAGATPGYGGSGAVLVKEAAFVVPAQAPGVWSMSTVYEKVKAGDWTN